MNAFLFFSGCMTGVTVLFVCSLITNLFQVNRKRQRDDELIKYIDMVIRAAIPEKKPGDLLQMVKKEEEPK